MKYARGFHVYPSVWGRVQLPPNLNQKSTSDMEVKISFLNKHKFDQQETSNNRGEKEKKKAKFESCKNRTMPLHFSFCQKVLNVVHEDPGKHDMWSNSDDESSITLV